MFHTRYAREPSAPQLGRAGEWMDPSAPQLGRGAAKADADAARASRRSSARASRASGGASRASGRERRRSSADAGREGSYHIAAVADGVKDEHKAHDWFVPGMVQRLEATVSSLALAAHVPEMVANLFVSEDKPKRGAR